MESISLDIASSMSTTIRFVTCPTCRGTLVELPGIPLYKCGRCATILKAKNANIGGSASVTNPMKGHGNSYNVAEKDEGDENNRDSRNEQYQADDEHTKGDENNRESRNEFPGEILKSSPNAESAQGIHSISVVEGHIDERSLVVEKEYKVLDQKNATHPEVSLSLEENNATKLPLTKDGYFKETQKEVHNFGPPSSEEIQESLPDNTRSLIGSMSKSPTKIYYASDERNFKGTNDRSANRPSRKDRLNSKKFQKDQLRIVHEPTASSSMTKVKSDFISKGGDWKQHYKLPEAKKFNDSDSHRMANMSRSSQLPKGNGIPSSTRLNFSEQQKEPHLENSTFYGDPVKMELLDKVYELKERLNQTHISSNQMRKGRFNVRGVGEETNIPSHNNDLAPRRNAYANVKHSGHHDDHPQGLGRTHQPEMSRVAFSGEANQCRNQMDCVCSHCCHQSCHHVTISCSHCILSHHAINPRNNNGNEYPSHSPSPQTRPNDKFSSQVLERNTDNQLHKKKDLRKLRLREKYKIVRRHIRPIAGGAPIMACHYCSELLQLPAEHALAKRHFYQLRCYSCERVMKLSLEKNVHLVPYIPTISAPPPSEIDDHSDAKHGRTRTSTYHSGNRMY